MKPSCLIVDDEPLARKGLAEDLDSIGLVTVKGMASSTREAGALLAAQPLDLLFLDIEFHFGEADPGRSASGTAGLDFLRDLVEKPLVILVTAYPQYALTGYEHGVVDYLVKPVPLLRLRAACEKAVEQHRLRCMTGQPHLFLKCNGVHERIDIADILFIEAANNYIRVHTTGKKLLVYLSLKGIEEQLPPGEFLQVHKSFLIARRHIRRIDTDSLTVGATRVPLSRRFKSSVLATLHLTNNS